MKKGALDQTIADNPETATTEPRALASGPLDSIANYALGDVIGRGGMGEVVLAHDRQIGRDVAIKRLRTDAPTEEAVARFLREARIQARLDHPAIVPVHELGRDANGHPYFTMKRLAGVTLADLLATGVESQQRLLRAFVDVALAIDFAHSRKIIHRDLKPSNVMLGDFGEVYVLDWGLARVLDEPQRRPPSEHGPIDSLSGVTAVGALLGTPGYMSPEQLRDASTVELATDSYALGAILFEILAGEPLHPRADALATTLAGIESSPTKRRPDRAIPPELDALCAAAAAADPAARPTARVLAEGVQSFLDGDRDLARRRDLAREAVEIARSMLAEDRRPEAMRAAGRALALDPASPAAEIVSRLMLEPPATPPPELVAELQLAEDRRTQTHARIAIVAYALFYVLIPIAIWNGVRSWSLVGGITALATMLVVIAWMVGRRPQHKARLMWIYVLGNLVLLGLISRVSSPLIMAPALASVVTGSLATYPTLVRRSYLITTGFVLAWLLPIALEAASILKPTWRFDHDKLIIQSYAIELSAPATSIFLVAVTVLTVAAGGALAGWLSIAMQQAQSELLRQRWQLAQLLPANSPVVRP